MTPLCSPAVLFDALPRSHEVERREVRDEGGTLVAIEVRRGFAFEAVMQGRLTASIYAPVMTPPASPPASPDAPRG